VFLVPVVFLLSATFFISSFTFEDKNFLQYVKIKFSSSSLWKKISVKRKVMRITVKLFLVHFT